MIKIESEEQLNRFDWKKNQPMNGPSAMELYRQGINLFYDGFFLFYNDPETNKRKNLFTQLMK